MDMHRLNPTDPMDDVDCWCTDTDRDLGGTQDYCPRHGTEPDWSLVDDGDREQQKAIRREHGTLWTEEAGA